MTARLFETNDARSQTAPTVERKLLVNGALRSPRDQIHADGRNRKEELLFKIDVRLIPRHHVPHDGAHGTAASRELHEPLLEIPAQKSASIKSPVHPRCSR